MFIRKFAVGETATASGINKLQAESTNCERNPHTILVNPPKLGETAFKLRNLLTFAESGSNS